MMAKYHSGDRQTQAQRRAETRSSLLASAFHLFGERGFDETSMEDIAEHSGLTIRPIYYYFRNKRGLFAAVNTEMEQRALDALSSASPEEAWVAFVTLCEDPAFRQIILHDAPNVLGRERWSTAHFPPWCQSLALDAADPGVPDDSGRDMSGRVALATFTEAAMVVTEAGRQAVAREAALQLISTLFQDPGSKPGQRLPAHELS